jgi:hypothetical protein
MNPHEMSFQELLKLSRDVNWEMGCRIWWIWAIIMAIGVIIYIINENS